MKPGMRRAGEKRRRQGAQEGMKCRRAQEGSLETWNRGPVWICLELRRS